MKFAIYIPNFGDDYADVRLVAEVAYEAEAAGWDGFFIWDHIGENWGQLPVSDSTVMLTAIALQTTSIKVGPLVTPLPRRRPWKLAREIATLDQMTGGRMVLGVGIGGGREFAAYREPEDDKIRGEMLDEGIEILTRLWSGRQVDFKGRYYELQDVLYLPRPIQQPRVPIWVAGRWPNKKPMCRAARWDGVFPIGNHLQLNEQLSDTAIRDCLHYIKAQQPDHPDHPYDVIHLGLLSGKDLALDVAITETYADAGVTWWLENINWERGSLQEQRARIRKGPPRLSP